MNIYVAEGNGTISCDPGTRSAVVVYDAEASLRRGQPAVLVFERNASDVVTAVKKVNIGRPSTDFLAGGVISSTLTSTNTSSVDDIAGSQTQAILYSVPKGVSDLTATDILQFATDKEAHLISNVSSKADNTRTFGITEHSGSATALLRDKARSNLAEIEYNVSASNVASQGFIAPATTLAVTTSDYIGNVADALYYSKRDPSVSPFSLASYVAHASLNVSLKNSHVSNAVTSATFIVVAMDAAGGVLDSTTIFMDPDADVAAAGTFDFQIDVNLSSLTTPIDSIAVFVSALPAGTLERTTSVSSGRISATEETADIPGRPIHFAVFEGLNPSASLNVHAANILAGTPDSTNAFISGGGSGEDVYDYSLVNNMLLTFRHTFPRAYTGMGAQIANEALKEWFQLEGMVVAMEAFSFKKIGRAFRQIGRTAKQVRSTTSKVADIAKPVLDEGGMLLASGMFGPRAQKVGMGMLAASTAIDQSQKIGVLEK
jgi:hypothetical protein